MKLNQNQKINLFITILLAVSFLIVLVYLNSVFEITYKINNFITQYRIAKLLGETDNTAKTATNPLEEFPNKKISIYAANSPALGPAEAKITIVEFSDFSCSACALMREPLKQVQALYGDQVRIVWKDFPITAAHPFSQKAAEAARCADKENKFWPYHDLLFANQDELSDEIFSTLAKELGLNLKKFDACFKNSETDWLVKQDFNEGIRLGVDGTPYLFINSQRIPNAASLEQLKEAIDQELAVK